MILAIFGREPPRQHSYEVESHWPKGSRKGSLLTTDDTRRTLTDHNSSGELKNWVSGRGGGGGSWRK